MVTCYKNFGDFRFYFMKGEIYIMSKLIQVLKQSAFNSNVLPVGSAVTIIFSVPKSLIEGLVASVSPEELVVLYIKESSGYDVPYVTSTFSVPISEVLDRSTEVRRQSTDYSVTPMLGVTRTVPGLLKGDAVIVRDKKGKLIHQAHVWNVINNEGIIIKSMSASHSILYTDLMSGLYTMEVLS